MEIEAISRSETFLHPLLENSFNPLSFSYIWYILGGLSLLTILFLCCCCIRCCYKSNLNLTSSSRLLPVPLPTLSSPTIRNLYTPPNLSPLHNTIASSIDIDILPTAPLRTYSIAEPEREMDTLE